MLERRVTRAFFRMLNRFFVVPAFRIGLGNLFSNSIIGHIMILKVSGRKTGKMRYVPLSYTVIDGKIYCYQGRRLKGQWYLNILANPKIEMILPGNQLKGYAEVVADPTEAAYAIRQLLKDSGPGGFIYGFNPFTAPDELVLDMTRDIPVVKITPIDNFEATSKGSRYSR